MKATHISVRTREGTALFRRAGYAFTRAPTELAIADLTPEQLAAIRDERELEVADAVLPAGHVPPPPPENHSNEVEESRRPGPGRKR